MNQLPQRPTAVVAVLSAKISCPLVSDRCPCRWAPLWPPHRHGARRLSETSRRPGCVLPSVFFLSFCPRALRDSHYSSAVPERRGAAATSRVAWHRRRAAPPFEWWNHAPPIAWHNPGEPPPVHANPPARTHPPPPPARTLPASPLHRRCAGAEPAARRRFDQDTPRSVGGAAGAHTLGAVHFPPRPPVGRGGGGAPWAGCRRRAAARPDPRRRRCLRGSRPATGGRRAGAAVLAAHRRRGSAVGWRAW